jgi:predicted nucleic acid-binding protein
MTNYPLDANHCSPLVTVHHPLRHRVEEARATGDTFGLVSPVLTEFVFGFLMLPRFRGNLQEWERLRPGFRIYSIDAEAAYDAALLRVALRRRGRQLATIDSLTAIIALREGLTLLTTDGDFAAVPDLRIENWVSPTK